MKNVRIRTYVYPAALIGLLIAFLITQGRLRQYWFICFLIWSIATIVLTLLYARSLKEELGLREWRKAAAGLDPKQINLNTAEGQRQWLLWLYGRGDYDEAAEYAATLSDEVLIDSPCEALADKVRGRKPEAARRLYSAAIAYYK